MAVLLAIGLSQSETARTLGLTRQRISDTLSRLRARFPEPIACSLCEYAGPIVADPHPISLWRQQFGLNLTDVLKAFGATNQRMYQVWTKGDRRGRVPSAVRRAAVAKGFSETEVDERLAAIGTGRTSIMEHILSAHRDDLGGALENLKEPLGEHADFAVTFALQAASEDAMLQRPDAPSRI